MASVTHDHLGSVRGLFDASENPIGTREFTPYGTTYLDDLGGAVTAGFTGHQLDGLTGDYFAPFRYYAPDAARWLKRDPLGMIDGPNMYAYVGGNPINFSDPLGLNFSSTKLQIYKILEKSPLIYMPNESQALLDEARADAKAGPIRGLLNLRKNHQYYGKFDFLLTEKDAIFCVNGEVLAADQFGNYIAGYAGESYGTVGLFGVYAAGILYNIFDSGSPTYFDNDGSRININQGAVAAFNLNKQEFLAQFDNAPTTTGYIGTGLPGQYIMAP